MDAVQGGGRAYRGSVVCRRSRSDPANPAGKVAKTQIEDKEMLFLDENQSRVFLAASESHRLHAMFVMAIGTGLRQGELLGLQWQDIDFEKKTVTVARSLTTVQSKFVLKSPKTKSSRRTIKLPDFVVAHSRSIDSPCWQRGTLPPKSSAPIRETSSASQT